MLQYVNVVVSLINKLRKIPLQRLCLPQSAVYSDTSGCEIYIYNNCCSILVGIGRILITTINILPIPTSMLQQLLYIYIS